MSIFRKKKSGRWSATFLIVITLLLGACVNPGDQSPTVLELQAMADTPQAAADFFNPDAGGVLAQERGEEIIQNRRWTTDGFEALSHALLVAATTNHHFDADPQLQEQSAWIASATVHYLAQRDQSGKKYPISDQANLYLAELLAAYTPDIDQTLVYGAYSTPGVSGPNPGDYSADSLAVTASFTSDQLSTVLTKILTDDKAWEVMEHAAYQWHTANLEDAATAWNSVEIGADTTREEHLIKVSAYNSGVLFGYLLGNRDRATQTETSFDQRQELILDLQVALVEALADSPHLPEGVRVDERGRTYPWFTTGTFDRAALDTPENMYYFVEWLNLDAAQLTIFKTEINTGVNAGLKKVENER